MPYSQRADGPLGVFDSGVGGLSVAGAILRRYPHDRVLYVADQAHVPYGGRPLDEVCGFATGISMFLASQGCRGVVMACNISSATALARVRKALAPLPVFGVIEPAARRAVIGPGAACPELAEGSLTPLTRAHPGTRDRARCSRIGVLATEGTVRSGAYRVEIQRLEPDAEVVQVPCPKLVPLVEAGETDSEEAEAAACEYLASLAEARCHTVILGCTHYPFLLPALRRAASRLFHAPVEFIDPADEMADAVYAAGGAPLGAPHGPRSPNLLLTTGPADTFVRQAPGFLPGVDYQVAGARWEGDRLIGIEQPVEQAR